MRLASPPAPAEAAPGDASGESDSDAIPEPIFGCNHCSKQYSDIDKLSRHQSRRGHRGATAEHDCGIFVACDECQTVLFNADALSHHQALTGHVGATALETFLFSDKDAERIGRNPGGLTGHTTAGSDADSDDDDDGSSKSSS